ncbi:MAG: hypothetical protein ACOH1Y_11480 [Propionicimonas sp.]
MPTCQCGSTTVHVTYQTPTTLTLVEGQPSTVDYGMADPMYVVARCGGCQAVMDIDQSITHGQAEGARPALTAAKTVAQAWLAKLPLVTLRARLLPEQPGSTSVPAATERNF